jgi:hypothetical protein
MKKYLVCLVLACAATLAFAADTSAKNQIGVFGGIHDSSYLIGISLPLSDALTLKPALGFRYISNPDQYAYETTSTRFMTTIDLLYQLKISSGLYFGVGPRIGFTLDSETRKFPAFTDKISTNNILFGAVGEVKYLFSKNFGAFLDGALSLSINSYKYDAEVGADTEYKSTSIDTSTAIGLAFYF